jgi:hypothetical protein
MLIAMLTNTFTEISQNSLEWLRQWSSITLMMEQSYNRFDRLQFQRNYSIPMQDRTRCALLINIRLSASDC